jgi:hypothetical protein
MPVDNADAASSFLHGRAEFNKWIDEFMVRWYRPDIILLLASAVHDAGLNGMLENPNAVIKTDKLVKKMTGRE